MHGFSWNGFIASFGAATINAKIPKATPTHQPVAPSDQPSHKGKGKAVQVVVQKHHIALLFILHTHHC